MAESDHSDQLTSAFDTLRLRLGVSQLYYTISKALRLNNLIDWLKRANLTLESPICVLGKRYIAPEDAEEEERQQPTITLHPPTLQVLAALFQHLQSVVWATYRTNFHPLVAGELQIKTDAGWGCTIRSLQMLLAQALQRHILGPEWRLVNSPAMSDDEQPNSQDANSSSPSPPPPAQLCSLLRYFWDVPDPQSVFSIHNICRYGAPCGVQVGRWLGPWVACRAAESAATHLPPNLSNFHVAVLAGQGGGAPLLFKHKFASIFPSADNNTTSLETAVGGEQGQRPTSTMVNNTNNNNSNTPGLLLLVPLVLGLGKITLQYIPQLQATLNMPQTVGIIGGRPGSSLYFLGCQEDAMLYLDPHTVQEAATSDADWESFRCESLRTWPMESIDPSLALGFYCSSREEYDDLCERLKQLDPAYPLVCITEAEEDENSSKVDDAWADEEAGFSDTEEFSGDDTCETKAKQQPEEEKQQAQMMAAASLQEDSGSGEPTAGEEEVIVNGVGSAPSKDGEMVNVQQLRVEGPLRSTSSAWELL